jgi:hypothetical protein
VTTVSTFMPFHSTVFTSPERVTSTRSLVLPPRPTWTAWSMVATGNSGFVIAVGCVKAGGTRSTRLLSG